MKNNLLNFFQFLILLVKGSCSESLSFSMQEENEEIIYKCCIKYTNYI